jgi:hypothetical protein
LFESSLREPSAAGIFRASSLSAPPFLVALLVAVIDETEQ